MNHIQITLFFFFNQTPTTEIYTLSLHDALPIYHGLPGNDANRVAVQRVVQRPTSRRIYLVHDFRFDPGGLIDRKSTRLNSSHPSISYAVFCLKKKKQKYDCE